MGLTDNSPNADLTGIGQGPGPHIPGDDMPPEEAERFGQMAMQLTTASDTSKFTSEYTPASAKVFRKLNVAENDLIHAIRTESQALDLLVKKVQAHLLMQRREAARLPVVEFDAELARIDAAEPGRWAAIGRTHFQEGLMALTRAVAQPSSF